MFFIIITIKGQFMPPKNLDVSSLQILKNQLYSETVIDHTEHGLNTFKTFLEKNAEVIEVNWLYYALNLAANNGNLPVVKLIFELFPHLDAKHLLVEDLAPTEYISNQKGFKASSNGETLIFAAINHPNILEYLITQKKLDPQLFNKRSLCVLHYACQSKAEGSLESVKYLTQHIDKDIKTKIGEGYEWTPLLLAAKFNQLNKVKYLLSIGANPNHQIDSNENALYYAYLHKNLEMLRLLASCTKDISNTKKYINNKKYAFEAGMRVLITEINYRESEQVLRSTIFQIRQKLLNTLNKQHLTEENSLEADDSIKNSACRRNFDNLDFFMSKIMKVLANYDPGMNQNRSESIDKIISSLEKIYTGCMLDFSPTNLKKLSNELITNCEKNILEIENDHLLNRKLKFTKSTLASSLREVIDIDGNHYKEPLALNINASPLEQFDTLVSYINLSNKWKIFLENNLTLCKDQNDIKLYNKDEKAHALQLLAVKINELKAKLNTSPNQYQEILIELRDQIKEVIKVAKNKSTLFTSHTASQLQSFLNTYLNPYIDKAEKENKSSYGENSRPPSLSNRLTFLEDGSL